MKNRPFRKNSLARTFMLALVFIGLSLPSFAQTGIILLDDNSQPVAGASVSVQGTEQGTISNDRGLAVLQITTERVVTISHVGFVTVEIILIPDQWQTVVLQTSTTALNSVVVEGFLENSEMSKQAGSISVLSPKALQRYDPTSLVQAVNSLPGIRFEERAGASYRISIRGSSVRSPFGVRNVKVYWNGIPFTEPGGNTFVNLLDLTNVSSMEILKGPAGSIYGAGTGGVIKLNSTVEGALKNAFQFSTVLGSYNTTKTDLLFNKMDTKSSFTVKGAIQKSDGYREHNAMDRKNIELDGLIFLNEYQTLTTSLLYSNLFYEIPGALNPDQRSEDRRQSRPGSIEKNASVSNQYALVKLGHELEWGNDWKFKTALFASTMDFENPFILDYKRDEQNIYGARLELTKKLKVAGRDAQAVFGGEFQKSAYLGKNFGNVMGQADTINFEDDIDSKQSLIFGSFNFEPVKDLFVTAGISRNALNYNIDRLVDKVNNNPQRFNKEFETVWSPRLGVSKKLNDHLSVHLSVSQGFSPPTTTEVRTNEGSINKELQPEKGTNYEWNLRGNLLQEKLTFDVAIFRLDLKESISTFTNEDGVVLFRNAGENRQQGVEVQLSGDWIKSEDQPIRLFNTTLAYTHHDFVYENFVDDGDDFSGNSLPGTAKNVVNLQFNVGLNNETSLHLTYHYSDAIPLNDENTVYSRPYNIWNMKYDYGLDLYKQWRADFFIGINNLFDVDYSLGNDLNAFGNRYFQPAPGRNYLFGVKIRFNYK